MIIRDKGREEIRKLIASGLVGTWAETDRGLRNIVRMRLSQRPDLIGRDCHPVIWQRIREREKRAVAAVILALLQATVVVEAGKPSVRAWDQAAFYYGTRTPR